MINGIGLKKEMKLSFINIKVVYCFLAIMSLIYVVPALAEPIRKHDYSNDISVETLRYRMSKVGKPVIADVRNNSDYEKIRISGSVNIPLFVLKTQKNLMGKKLVLVNEGFSRTLLEKECEKLIKAGFNAKILSGGLTAWQKKGHLLIGDQFEAKKLNRIKSIEFFMEKDFQNTFLIEISEIASGVFTNSEKSKHVPVAGNTSKLEKYIFSLKSKTPLSVVVTNKDGKNYDRIGKQLSKSGEFNLFFLEGGSDQYLSLIEKKARMHKTRKQRLVKQEGCVTCGDNEE